MGKEGTEAGISPLIQINEKIFRIDAIRLTVIWHTINLASLSSLHPLHLLGVIHHFVLSDSPDPLYLSCSLTRSY